MHESGKTQIVTSLRVDPELWKEAKVEAIKHDMTLTEVVEEALKKWIHEKGSE
jgi:predicted HicB family RNase H-like nuclease